MRKFIALIPLMLFACSAGVSDLDDLTTDDDACDPRGSAALGTDLDLTFLDLDPHKNQDMFFAITVGEERDIEALMVFQKFDDPDMHLVVPKLLPEGQSELAFWADANPMGYNGLDEDVPDHQWTRPVCPNGKVHFEHTTPFQSVKEARSTGAIFAFQLPQALRDREELFREHKMWVRATLLDDDTDEELQTRVFYRWAPLVDVTDTQQEAREIPMAFQVGGNALDEPRGAIDTLSFYNIEFVIDFDDSNDSSAGDFTCTYMKQQAPDDGTWSFVPDLTQCDPPDDFGVLDLRDAGAGDDDAGD